LPAVVVVSRYAEDLCVTAAIMAGNREPEMRLTKQVFLTRIRYFVCADPLPIGLAVSPVSPECRQALAVVVDFIESFYGVRVAYLHLSSLWQRSKFSPAEMTSAVWRERERSRDEHGQVHRMLATQHGGE